MQNYYIVRGFRPELICRQLDNNPYDTVDNIITQDRPTAIDAAGRYLRNNYQLGYLSEKIESYVPTIADWDIDTLMTVASKIGDMWYCNGFLDIKETILNDAELAEFINSENISDDELLVAIIFLYARNVNEAIEGVDEIKSPYRESESSFEQDAYIPGASLGDIYNMVIDKYSEVIDELIKNSISAFRNYLTESDFSNLQMLAESAPTDSEAICQAMLDEIQKHWDNKYKLLAEKFKDVYGTRLQTKGEALYVMAAAYTQEILKVKKLPEVTDDVLLTSICTAYGNKQQEPAI